MPDVRRSYHTQLRGTQVRTNQTIEVPSPAKPARRATTAFTPQPAREDAKPLSFAERMLRNTAFCIAALLCVLAVQNVDSPATAWVSGELREIVTMDIDENLGSLQFVKNILPESAMVFWNIGDAQIRFLSPVSTQVAHAWHAQEPWVGYECADPTEVTAAAAGEVMALSYQDDQTIMLRIRHENGMETVYGNLSTCMLREGDLAEAGQKIGNVAASGTLLFEIRDEGRSVNPAPLLKEAP